MNDIENLYNLKLCQVSNDYICNIDTIYLYNKYDIQVKHLSKRFSITVINTTTIGDIKKEIYQNTNTQVESQHELQMKMSFNDHKYDDDDDDDDDEDEDEDDDEKVHMLLILIVMIQVHD